MMASHRRAYSQQRGIWIAFAVALYVTGVIGVTGIFGIIGVIGSVPVWAADGGSVARGGRLFDSWFLESKDRPPAQVHPQYKNFRPSMNAAGNSWRCAACHGWDYQGRADQQTGALSGTVGADAASLAAILQDNNHRYGDKLPNRDLTDLAAFIAGGLIDMAPYIEPGSKRTLGDATREVVLYATICANCHGSDGQRITTIMPLGDFARRHPREALHKIFNGHPGERMPPLRFLKAKRSGDLLAYTQTLPAKDLSASITRGGRLYDHWQKETGAEPPTSRHPAYPRQAAQATNPQSNWRCKECHGWDYKGRDGAYAKGPHRTGIKGIRAMAGREPQAVIALLMDANHRYHGTSWFKAPLDLQDLIDLANFVTRGQIDMAAYIDPQTGIAKGDAQRRRDDFNILCATCHGRDGTALLTGKAIGSVARSNPWEALHKIRNGHPNEAMPALRALDKTLLVDILAYAQTLP